MSEHSFDKAETLQVMEESQQDQDQDDQEEDSSEDLNGSFVQVAWQAPPVAVTRPSAGPPRNAILALQAAAIAAKQFDQDFVSFVRDEGREANIPLFYGDEIVTALEPLREWDGGRYEEYQVKAVRTLAELIQEGDFNRQIEKSRARIVQRSIDGYYSVKLLQSGVMEIADVGIQAAEDFMTETRLLMNMAPHPNVIQIYGINKGGIDTLLEKGCKGFFILTDCIDETLPERLVAWRAKTGYRPAPPGQTVRRFAQRLEIALDIASALLFLHERNLVFHVRPDKIGFDIQQGLVKLCQFGQARPEGSANQARSLLLAQDMRVIAYTAPEVLCNAPATRSSDVYSFGILLWEIMSLKCPFAGLDRETHMDRCVQNNVRPPMNRQWPAPCQELLQSTWHPYKRLTMRKVHSRLMDLLTIHEENTQLRKSTKTTTSSSSSHHRRGDNYIASHLQPVSPKSTRSERTAKTFVTEATGTDMDTPPPSSPSKPEQPTLQQTLLKEDATPMATSADLADKEKDIVLMEKVLENKESTVEPCVIVGTDGQSARTPSTLPDVPVLSSAIEPAKEGRRQQQRNRSSSPYRMQHSVPNENEGKSGHRRRNFSPFRQRAPRRSSIDVTSTKPAHGIDTTSVAPQTPVARPKHRSASMSHVTSVVDPVSPTSLNLNHPKQQEDYEEDYQEDQPRTPYAQRYLSRQNSSPSLSQRVNQSPLRKRLGEAMGAVGNFLRRPSASGASVSTSQSNSVRSRSRTTGSSRNNSPLPSKDERHNTHGATKSKRAENVSKRERTRTVTGKGNRNADTSPENSGDEKKWLPSSPPRTQITTKDIREFASPASPAPRSPQQTEEGFRTPEQYQAQVNSQIKVKSRISEPLSTPLNSPGKSSCDSVLSTQKSDNGSVSKTNERDSSSEMTGLCNVSPSSQSLGNDGLPSVRQSSISLGLSSPRRQRANRGLLSPRRAGMRRLSQRNSANSYSSFGENDDYEEDMGTITLTILSDEEDSDDDRRKKEKIENTKTKSRDEKAEALRRRRAADGHVDPAVLSSPVKIRQRRRSTGGATPMTGVENLATTGILDGSPCQADCSKLTQEVSNPALKKQCMSSQLDDSASQLSNSKLEVKSNTSRRNASPRTKSNDDWMQDIVKPLNESSTNTANTSSASSTTIDSERIDKLVEPDQADENEVVQAEPSSPRRRLARLGSVTSIFRKSGSEEAKESTLDAASRKKMARSTNVGRSTNQGKGDEGDMITYVRSRRASIS